MKPLIISSSVNISTLISSLVLSDFIDAINAASNMRHDSAFFSVWCLLTVIANAACAVVMLSVETK